MPAWRGRSRESSHGRPTDEHVFRLEIAMDDPRGRARRQAAAICLPHLNGLGLGKARTATGPEVSPSSSSVTRGRPHTTVEDPMSCTTTTLGWFSAATAWSSRSSRRAFRDRRRSRRKNLHCDVASSRGVVGFVDLPHSADPEQLTDIQSVDPLTREEPRGGRERAGRHDVGYCLGERAGRRLLREQPLNLASKLLVFSARIAQKRRPLRNREGKSGLAQCLNPMPAVSRSGHAARLPGALPSHAHCSRSLRPRLRRTSRFRATGESVGGTIVAAEALAVPTCIRSSAESNTLIGSDCSFSAPKLLTNARPLCGDFTPAFSNTRLTRCDSPFHRYRKVQVPPGAPILSRRSVFEQTPIIRIERVLSREVLQPYEMVHLIGVAASCDGVNVRERCIKSREAESHHEQAGQREL